MKMEAIYRGGNKVKWEEMIGKRYGRLRVIQDAGRTEAYARKLLCRCDCGNEVIVFASNLRRGHTTSCGCIKHEIVKAGAHTVHGGCGSRLYSIWKGMRRRCQDIKAINYSRYGGRGIKVCKDWDESFSSFREWALKNGYSEDKSIDRIDNDKGYSPDNCRWSTVKEQANNRRSNHVLEMNGEIHTIAEWADITGIAQCTILQRIRHGFDTEDILSTHK